MSRVTLRDLARPPEVVAPALLGATLVVRAPEGCRRVRLVEVEAYGGLDDPASHAARGPTPRCAVMFGPAGRLYVYRSYGRHWCANVVTGPPGVAGAVLLRAGEVLDARGRPIAAVRGPGLLARYLGLTGADTGASLIGSGARRAWMRRAEGDLEVAVSGRVGISREVERPWRFVVAGHPVAGRGPRPATGVTDGGRRSGRRTGRPPTCWPP